MDKLGKSPCDLLLLPALPVEGPASWEGDGGREIGNCWPLLSTDVYMVQRKLLSSWELSQLLF